MDTQSNGSEKHPETNTKQHGRGGFWDRRKSIPKDRLAWLWLVVGFILLPFTFFQTVIPLAAWLAPIFLLRFERTSRRACISLLMIFLAYAAGIGIALRGFLSSDMTLNIIGLINFPLLKGLIFTLPYAADRLIGSRPASMTRLLVFPLAFTSVDWLMSLSAFINSTGSPAYSQYDNLALMQILSITGMWGITFLIMWCATTANALWEHAFEWRTVRLTLGTFAVVLLAVLLFGNARLAFSAPASQTVEAGTITVDSAISSMANSSITGNFNHATDAQRLAVRPKLALTINQLLARTEVELRGGAKLVTWQEGAGTVLEEDKQIVLNQVAVLAKQYDAYIQVSLGVITRRQEQHFIRNQSILVDNMGTVRWTYDKTYLVYPNEHYVFIAGPGQLPVADTPYGRLSTAICNDLHFTPLIHQAGQNGVDILITPYHDVHPFESEDAVVATYRAIENGFSLLRPAGAGLSTITDYQGRILATQNFFTNTDGIMMTTVPIHGVTTVYSWIGDLFAYLCTAGLVFVIVWVLLRRRQTTTAHWTDQQERPTSR
ncbi:MAG: nitrilase-related carbon-nitrogen hydrolase [Anaerolineales bacterium]|jgi:apolipoprotein N-acyltransferase